MPETPVNENRKAPSGEDEVRRTSGNNRPVEPETKSECVHGSPEFLFRTSIAGRTATKVRTLVSRNPVGPLRFTRHHV